jgi:hypothetical protein
LHPVRNAAGLQQFRIIGPAAEFARIDRFVVLSAKRYGKAGFDCYGGEVHWRRSNLPCCGQCVRKLQQKLGFEIEHS